MERLDFIVFALWGFILVLAALNIVYVVYSKITLIYMKTSDMIRFALKMLWYRILYFFFTKENDTITFNNATIYRNSDTLRLVQSCPPCTTTITKQILQPTKEYFKEKRYQRSLREKLEDAIFPFIVGILVCALISKK